MMMKSKQQILDEARRHIDEVNRGFTAQLPPVEDPIRAWARDSEQRAAQREAARRERQAEEQRERGVQFDWDGWFVEQLRKHCQRI